MFHAAFDSLCAGEKVLDALNREAEDKIITRGYSPSAKVPPDLSNQKWFLPINALAYSYCPTDRYLYLSTIEKVQLENTWKRYKGYVIDELLPKLYDHVLGYLDVHSIPSLNLPKDLVDKLNEMVAEYKDNFNREALKDSPTTSQIDKFFNFLPTLVNYEGLLISAFLAHRVTNILNLDLKKDFRVMFPFDFKLKFNGHGLGIYPEAEVDFIYRHNILGEIKSQEWQEFYYTGLAGYALAYEYDTRQKINLGLIVCPIYHSRRRVPFYNNTAQIRVVEESWRKAFLTNRNIRIKMIKDETEPSRPNTDEKCKGCGYYRRCWEE